MCRARIQLGKYPDLTYGSEIVICHHTLVDQHHRHQNNSCFHQFRADLDITASTENERVETALDFRSMGTANAFIAMQGTGDATDVTWGFSTDLGMNPISRWMGLMMG